LTNYTGLDLPSEPSRILIDCHAKDALAFNAIVDLAEGKNKVMAVTSGHDHGESWCARSYNSSGISLWYVRIIHSVFMHVSNADPRFSFDGHSG